MRVLVSGFQPFLDEKVNPTQEIVRFVNSMASSSSSWPVSLAVRAVLLPVLFDNAFQQLEKVRLEFEPDVILSFGLAGGRDSFDIEQIAVNLRGGNTGSGNIGRPPDNAGVMGEGTIIHGAPDSLPTTLPSDVILNALREAGIPARESFSAGTYVCNDLFFQMQNHLRFTNVRSGFIHVPRQAGDAAQDSLIETKAAWPWERFEKAVTAILRSFN